MIADAELGTGWVQVENVLPFSVKNLRPGWLAHRRHHEQLVISMKDIFDKMWDNSKEPNKAVIKQLMG
jgi:hypothetical protein